jgi:hypothetical protein
VKRLITLALPYYLNPGMLAEQYRVFKALPCAIKEALRLIVVDDGSPADAAWAEDIGVELKVFRMDEDIRWNQDACRNLAVAEAVTDWILMTDIDHVVPEETWGRVLDMPLEPNTAYRFSRVSMPELEPYKLHPNTWLMRKTLFDLVGGYDERFRGWYGTDGDFKSRLGNLAPIVQLKEAVIRYPREVIPDASTTTLTRKTEEDGEAIRRIKGERSREIDGRPRRFLTSWHRVA